MALHIDDPEAGALANELVNLTGETAAQAVITALNGHMLTAANFLMAMAMAGMGLQVDFAQLRARGLRAGVVAVVGWLGLAGLAAAEIALLT